MTATLINLLLAFVVSPLASAASIPPPAPRSIHVTPRQQDVWVTPHWPYSSSIGVLGCKINANRVAYWPGAVDCNNLCVKVTNTKLGISVNLLKIDSSTTANDISYDAWHLLSYGVSAKDTPPQDRKYGGPMGPFHWEYVNADECKPYIKDGSGKLPLAAANSMSFLASCLSKDQGGSSPAETWVGKNYKLLNINDPVCDWGYDEECFLEGGDLKHSNQPNCTINDGSGHGLGSGAGTAPLTGPKYVVEEEKAPGFA